MLPQPHPIFLMLLQPHPLLLCFSTTSSSTTYFVTTSSCITLCCYNLILYYSFLLQPHPKLLMLLKPHLLFLILLQFPPGFLMLLQPHPLFLMFIDKHLVHLTLKSQWFKLLFNYLAFCFKKYIAFSALYRFNIQRLKRCTLTTMGDREFIINALRRI